MKAYQVSTVCLLIGALVIAHLRVQAKPTRSEDEQQIRLILASRAAASQHGDLHGLVDVYHSDADVRYSDGTVVHGKAELETRYRQALSSDPHAVSPPILQKRLMSASFVQTLISWMWNLYLAAT